MNPRNKKRTAHGRPRKKTTLQALGNTAKKGRAMAKGRFAGRKRGN
jgi:hypothetical protein